MSPQNVLDAAQLIATAGATLAVLVQLIKFGFAPLSDRLTVGLAIGGGAVLVALYGAGNGLLTLPNAFPLVVATVAVAATGAGIHSATTAAVSGGDNKPAVP